MKAHIGVNIMTKKQYKEAVKVGNEAFRKAGEEHTRRILKIACIALNEKFGFGAKRCGQFLEEVTSISDKHMDDEAFWIHADKRLDQIGLPFIPEDYERMEI